MGTWSSPEIPGFGPILPATARQLLQDSLDVNQIAVDEHGTVIAVGTPIPVRANSTAPSTTETAPAEADPVTEAVTEAGEAAEAEVADANHPADESEVSDAPEAPVDAARVQVRVQPVDPIVQALLAMAHAPVVHALGTSAYRVPARRQRYLEDRDRTCVFPGCTRLAAQTDKDHRTPWPAGATDAENLQGLCRHHHRAKHATFTVQLTAHGDYLWDTRSGWQCLRRHQGY